MSDSLVRYTLNDGVATLAMDDGKRNALSPAMFEALYAAFDRAERDRAIVILTGREEVFSAGFDLKVMKRGNLDTLRMLNRGYRLTARVLEYPYPVIAASPGHVMAMGVFLLLACDYNIGSLGDFRITANEVAIGIPMPRVAAMMLQHRLTPAAYQRAVTLAEQFPVEAAREAGFFDEVVEPGELMASAEARARQFAELHMPSHATSKRMIRGALIRRIRRTVPRDLLTAVLLGLRGGKPR